MVNVEKCVSLKPFNTFAIEAEAEYFAIASTVNDVEDLLRYANENRLSVIILGRGSNILPSGKLVKGLVIKIEITGISYEEIDGMILAKVGAGVLLDDLVTDTVNHGYWGLENLSHIPGTVGATPIQNVGAYGVEVAELIKEVTAININTGEKKKFTNDECGFGYRDSFFKTEVGKQYVVTEVVFKLCTEYSPRLDYAGLKKAFADKPVTQEAIRGEIIDIRSQKFPDWHKIGTAGSFFKNPIIPEVEFNKLKIDYPDLPGFPMGHSKVKLPIAWVLDHVCSLRDHREGNVGTYKGQALVIINYGGATSEEIKKFADNIVNTVKDKIGIEIEREVTIV